MSTPAPVRRVHVDLTRLHRAQQEQQRSERTLGAAQKALSQDRNQVTRDRGAFKKDARSLDREFKAKARLVDAKAARVGPLDARKQQLQAQRAADTFDHDPVLPGIQKDPALQQRLATLSQHRVDVATGFNDRLDAAKAKIEALKTAKGSDRSAIQADRKELQRARQVVGRDQKGVQHDEQARLRARHTAMKDLRPAEEKMGLSGTNHLRQALGLRSVHHVIRAQNLSTVQGCAQFLLHSKNVSFWSGLSSGSDRKNVARLARGEKAYVPATGGTVKPKLNLMQALVSMAKRGHIQINALTGGTHSPGSNHYNGSAVDLDLSTGNAGMIEKVAGRYGGARNFETSHIHLDF